jgi:glycosyltransferase involved in cell wall biosynthesis
MAMGLPCVLTDVGGASEMIFEGINGYIVKPNNPNSIMEGWIKAMDLDHNFPEKIINIVRKNFALEKCVNKYQDLILN